MADDVMAIVTDRIIDVLEKGCVPWRKPWCAPGRGAFNRISGRQYSLLNQMMLLHEGGASDPELAEVRLTPGEYKKLWQRIQSAEKAAQEATDDADKREIVVLREANRQLDEYKRKVDAAADQKVVAAQSAQQMAEQRASILEAEKSGIEESLKKQQNLNNNLKRIARERANARRGIRPKKEHDGYVVLYSMQWRERYRDSNGEKCVANVWKSVLQTPYDASLPLDAIQDEIWEELIHAVLYPLGFRQAQPVEKNGEYRTWTGEDEDGIVKELCGLYRWDCKANYKSGLWELNLYHTKSLRVPEEYRPIDWRKKR